MNRAFRTGVALGLAMLLTTDTGAFAQNELPDLRLEIDRTDNDRTVILNITNRSQWWSNDTSVTVETVSPAPANRVTLTVRELDPGQSRTVTYTLAGPCAGHVVKAELAPGRNFEGKPETALGDNTVQTQVCPAPAEAWESPIPGVIGIGRVSGTNADTFTRPEYARIGSHELRFESIGARTSTLQKTSFQVKIDFGLTVWGVGGDATVGFSQKEYLAGDPVEIARTALILDLGQLAELPRINVTSAILEYKESPVRWTSGGNAPQNKSGCVTRIGRVPMSVDDIPGNTQIPAVDIVPVAPGALTLFPIFRQIDVTGFVSSHLSPPARKSPLGLVVMGPLDDADGDDDTSCFSSLSDVSLKVSYEVLR